jgi:hypothetical protein
MAARAATRRRNSPPTARRSTSAATPPTTAPSAPPPAGGRASTWMRGCALASNGIVRASPTTSPVRTPMNATTIMIPQADPGAGYRAQKAEIDAAVARALGSAGTSSARRARPSSRIRRLARRRARVGCANGTDALTLIAARPRHRAGHDGRTVSHTAVATVAAIEMVGATPLLLDIDPTPTRWTRTSWSPCWTIRRRACRRSAPSSRCTSTARPATCADAGSLRAAWRR